jgi:hypothetical protein
VIVDKEKIERVVHVKETIDIIARGHGKCASIIIKVWAIAKISFW